MKYLAISPALILLAILLDPIIFARSLWKKQESPQVHKVSSKSFNILRQTCSSLENKVVSVKSFNRLLCENLGIPLLFQNLIFKSENSPLILDYQIIKNFII